MNRQKTITRKSSRRFLRVRGATVEISAEFDAARYLSRFVKFFPIIPAIGMIFLFGVSFGAFAYFNSSFRQSWTFLMAFGIILVPLLPSKILSPLTARRIEKNSR